MLKRSTCLIYYRSNLKFIFLSFFAYLNGHTNILTCKQYPLSSCIFVKFFFIMYLRIYLDEGKVFLPEWHFEFLISENHIIINFSLFSLQFLLHWTCAMWEMTISIAVTSMRMWNTWDFMTTKKIFNKSFVHCLLLLIFLDFLIFTMTLKVSC